MPKKAFSGKKKKEQMKEKRLEKTTKANQSKYKDDEDVLIDNNTELKEIKPIARDLADLHLKQNKSGTRRLRKGGRYKEDEYNMDKQEKERWRLDSIQRPLQVASTIEWKYQYETEELGIAERPNWEGLNADKLHILEEHAVRKWAFKVEETANELETSINEFEDRIGPWRALWQLLDICNIFVIVLDARLPPFFYPSCLVKEILKRGKSVIIVLNKCELNKYSNEWVDYYQNIHKLEHVCMVSSKSEDSIKEFAQYLENIAYKLQQTKSDEKSSDDVEIEIVTNSDDIASFGMLGHPNVGKSSLINGLLKHWEIDRAAAANPTPGRTQHNQTFPILNKNIILNDCPGITFPLLGISLSIAIMMGSYSISQIREPLSILRFILEHIGGAEVLLHHMKLMTGIKGGKKAILDLYGEDDEENIGPWTPYLCAEVIAIRKHMIVRGGKPDIHATCLYVIKHVFLGTLPCIALRPPVPSITTSIISEDVNEQGAEQEGINDEMVDGGSGGGIVQSSVPCYPLAHS